MGDVKLSFLPSSMHLFLLLYALKCCKLSPGFLRPCEDISCMDGCSKWCFLRDRCWKRFCFLADITPNNCIFLFYAFLILWHLGVLDSGGACPFRASQFIEITKGLARSTSFPWRANTPKCMPQPPLHLTHTHQVSIFCFLNHPRARYQATRYYPYCPKPTGIVQSSEPQALYPTLFLQKPQDGLWLDFSLTPIFCLLPILSFPCSPAWSGIFLSLGKYMS